MFFPGIFSWVLCFFGLKGFSGDGVRLLAGFVGILQVSLCTFATNQMNSFKEPTEEADSSTR